MALTELWGYLIVLIWSGNLLLAFTNSHSWFQEPWLALLCSSVMDWLENTVPHSSSTFVCIFIAVETCFNRLLHSNDLPCDTFLTPELWLLGVMLHCFLLEATHQEKPTGITQFLPLWLGFSTSMNALKSSASLPYWPQHFSFCSLVWPCTAVVQLLPPYGSTFHLP
jgi:hypothetical protein